jgi:hypothetical protein
LFWIKVDTSAGAEGCWPWLASKHRGYGQFGKDGKVCAAHRVAYELATGEQIRDGLEIDHRCRNRSCVNPHHLRPVTRKQNLENLSGANRNNQSSGVRGVYRAGTHWRAMAGHNRMHVHAGCFATIGEADAAVRAKRLELFTHNEIDKQIGGDTGAPR